MTLRSTIFGLPEIVERSGILSIHYTYTLEIIIIMSFFVCLFVCLFVNLLICWFVGLFVCLFVCLFVFQWNPHRSPAGKRRKESFQAEQTTIRSRFSNRIYSIH